MENKGEYKAETINYIGNVSMPYSHYHEHYEILYVRENSRILTVNNSDKHILNDTNIALIKPFLIHKTLSDENKKQKRSLINFSFASGEEIAEFSKYNILKCFDYPVIEMGEKTRKKVSEYMDELSLLKEESEFYEIEFKSGLLKILILLAKESEKRNIKKNEGGKGVLDIIPFIAQKIQKCCGEDLSLKTLAEEFHISPCYLSRCFKENMGISLVKYINNVRIIAAQKLMNEGYTSVTAVAMQVGFSNITHFERVFKAIAGISPKQYIKSYKKFEKAK